MHAKIWRALLLYNAPVLSCFLLQLSRALGARIDFDLPFSFSFFFLFVTEFTRRYLVWSPDGTHFRRGLRPARNSRPTDPARGRHSAHSTAPSCVQTAAAVAAPVDGPSPLPTYGSEILSF